MALLDLQGMTVENGGGGHGGGGGHSNVSLLLCDGEGHSGSTLSLVLC
ncbi:SapB/AmfS family lanthipeptide [Actinomadura craniellae]|nr:SapB/AmfS family lanthipeptide [Actinomadura craniellae]